MLEDVYSGTYHHQQRFYFGTLDFSQVNPQSIQVTRQSDSSFDVSLAGHNGRAIFSGELIALSDFHHSGPLPFQGDCGRTQRGCQQNLVNYAEFSFAADSQMIAQRLGRALLHSVALCAGNNTVDRF
jgi:hypothetical protein